MYYGKKNKIQFSVLLSVYFKENPVFLEKALESLFKQTLLMDEIVLVKDGVLSCELNTIIDNYVKKYPNLIKVVTLEKNVCLKYLINYDILLTNSEIIDYNGKSLNENLFKKNPLQSNFFSILYKMPFHGCCMAFKKDVLNFALPFSVNLPLHDNWIGILCSINKNYKISYIEEPLVLYRQHSDNVSGISTNSFFYKVFYRLIFSMQVFKRFLKHK